ncbi:MAG: PAS domain S-box protein [Propionibacteriaceae bacterium]|jgi:PAS domain S-box-containing protein|nr:PAS domain S-box protein [Propionibacteriaceae bacterium]
MSSGLTEQVNQRVLRDLTDGVMVLSEDGQISYLNQAARQILGLTTEDPVDQSFASWFIGEPDNDDFVEVVVQAITDKTSTHRAQVAYRPPAADQLKQLALSSSFVYDEAGQQQGISIVISDITPLADLERRRREGNWVFTGGMCVTAAYLIIWQLLAAFMVVPNWLMARVMELLAIGLAVFTLTKTSMTFTDVGLKAPPGRLRGTLLRGVSIGLGVIAVLAAARIVIDTVDPALTSGLPFFSFYWNEIWQITYFVVAPLQEFLAKGIVLVALLRIYATETRELHFLPIMVSSLVFAALHANYGIGMMAGAFSLCFATGWLYLKDRNIWGCAIIHFCLGFFATCFGLRAII